MGDIVENAWEVVEAPQRIESGTRSLVAKLELAVAPLPCTCNGLWQRGAEGVLLNNGIVVDNFVRSETGFAHVKCEVVVPPVVMLSVKW